MMTACSASAKTRATCELTDGEIRQEWELIMLSRPAIATPLRTTKGHRGRPGHALRPKNLDTNPTQWRQTAESLRTARPNAYSALSTFRICLRMVLRICGSSSIFWRIVPVVSPVSRSQATHPAVACSTVNPEEQRSSHHSSIRSASSYTPLVTSLYVTVGTTTRLL